MPTIWTPNAPDPPARHWTPPIPPPPGSAHILGGIAVAAIILPDDTPLDRWVAACLEMDDLATQRMAGRYAVPGGVEKAEITYPDLRDVRGVRFVYVAWRGQVRFRQQATGVAPVSLPEIAAMGAGGARMVPGAPYQWVFARPWLLIAHLMPAPPRSPCYGAIRFLDDPEPPRWILTPPN